MLFSKYSKAGKLDFEEFASQMALRGSPATANMNPSFAATREPPNQILNEIRTVICARGIYGIRDFVRLFRSVTKNGRLSRHETQWALRKNGQHLSEQEFERIFKYFDKNCQGHIGVEDLINGVRGGLNEYRKSVVDAVWSGLHQDGQVSVGELAGYFNLNSVAAYKNGQRTSKDILDELIEQIDGDGDGVITTQEWCEFYTNVSVSFENDLVFEKFVRSSWDQYQEPAATIMRRTMNVSMH